MSCWKPFEARAHVIFVCRARADARHEQLPHAAVAAAHGVAAWSHSLKSPATVTVSRVRRPHREAHARDSLAARHLRAQHVVGLVECSFGEQVQIRNRRACGGKRYGSSKLDLAPVVQLRAQCVTPRLPSKERRRNRRVFLCHGAALVAEQHRGRFRLRQKCPHLPAVLAALLRVWTQNAKRVAVISANNCFDLFAVMRA